MVTEQFETPFGYFEVLRNGKPIAFSVDESNYNTFYLNGELPVHPDGCYTISIPTAGMSKGDVIIARCSVRGFVYDGGGELTHNAVAELEHFAVGLGCADTDDYERHWEWAKKDYPEMVELFETQHMLPYTYWGVRKERDGFEFHITDIPEKYLQCADSQIHRNRVEIQVALVWNKNTDEYAYDIVGFLTC